MGVGHHAYDDNLSHNPKVVRKKVGPRPLSEDEKRRANIVKKHGKKAYMDTAGEYGALSGTLSGTKSVRKTAISGRAGKGKGSAKRISGLKTFLKSEQGVNDLTRKKRKAAHNKRMSKISGVKWK